MTAASTSRGSRRLVAAGVGFLVAWQVAAVAGAPRRYAVPLGLLGFVLHVVFGKSYALVPTYFERTYPFERVPTATLATATPGVVLVVLGKYGGKPVLTTLGVLGYAIGTGLWVLTLAWTVRDNPTGSQSGTGEHNQHRRTLDRVANAFVPVALAFIALGVLELVAGTLGRPVFVTTGGVGVAHLAGAGGATTLLFAVGFRALPRFTVTNPPANVAAVVLGSGAIGAALVVAGFGSGVLFRAGAVLLSVAVAGFAATWSWMLLRTERDRVGFYGVLAAVWSGVFGVALGLGFAMGHLSLAGEAVVAHFRLTLLGFLGLAIVGVLYQFYPPAVGQHSGASDRTALVSIVALAAGVWIEAAGLLAGVPEAVLAGRVLGLLGSVAVAFLVAAVFFAQKARR